MGSSPSSLICHCKCHHFILLLATVTGPTLSPLYLLCLPFSPLQRFPSLPPLPPSFLSSFLFFSPPPLSTTHCCIRFPHVANDCPGKGIFCFNLTLFPREDKKRGGTSFLQLVSLRKLFRIASFQGRLANAYNPGLSAIVRHNLAIILCLFHLENPYPIKVIQPLPIPAPN